MCQVRGDAILFVSGHPDRDTRERTSSIPFTTCSARTSWSASGTVAYSAAWSPGSATESALTRGRLGCCSSCPVGHPGQPDLLYPILWILTQLERPGEFPATVNHPSVPHIQGERGRRGATPERTVQSRGSPADTERTSDSTGRHTPPCSLLRFRVRDEEVTLDPSKTLVGPVIGVKAPYWDAPRRDR
jgi:hypothetical protein